MISASKQVVTRILFFEEGRLNWLDLSSIQSVRENYSYRAHASRTVVAEVAYTTANTRQSFSTASRASQGAVRHRVCKNYNSGTCKHDTGYLSNGFTYEHFCRLCATKGSRFNHTEQTCLNKGKSECTLCEHPLTPYEYCHREHKATAKVPRIFFH